MSTEAADPTDAYPTSGSAAGPRVLVVEDGAPSGASLVEALRTRGYEGVARATAGGALEAMERVAPTLVILDLSASAAAELCRGLRRSVHGRRPLILATVEDDDPDTLLALLVAGADDYVRKPVDAGVLDIRIAIASGRLRLPGYATTARQDAEERRGSRNRDDEIVTLCRVAEMALAARSLESAAEAILAEVARAMGVPVVLLERLDHARDRLVIAACHGTDLCAHGPVELPVQHTPSAPAVQTGRPTVVTDLAGARDPLHDSLRPLGARFWASFPLTTGGAVAGTLTMADTRPGRTDDRWVRLGSTFAAIVAQLLDRIEAQRALRSSESRHRELASRFGQATQELESFAYSVSHDLRAPLRTMQGFAHAMLQNHGSALPPEARDYTRRIIASGRQSERLIADLLAYSRLSFEKVEMRAVELTTVVEQALEQIEADLRERDAEVAVAPGLPTVLGSHTTLVQVIANLLSNAIKFVPPDRRPSVRVRAEARDAHVRLFVEDNGVGIPDGKEDRIFRVFERLEVGGDHPGTGIGLAIVRRGMQRIDGSCGVEPLPGGGSAFWIEAVAERRKTRRPWTRRGGG